MTDTIGLVHAKEIRGFLKRLGFLESVEAGQVTCSCCGSVVTVETFKAVERRGGKLRFYCAAPACTVDPVSARDLAE